jgi:endonuclease/exonuclease/phosphatase family metal-dependent hydrolase
MKLICHNVQGGRHLNPLLDFLKSEDADIYCLQEVFDCALPASDTSDCPQLMDELRRLLPDHVGFYAAMYDGLRMDGPSDLPVSIGTAIFVRKSVVVLGESHTFISGARSTRPVTTALQPRVAHAVVIATPTPLRIVNVHGWVGNCDKRECPERAEQMRKLLAFVGDNRALICGDFNAWPFIESMRTLAQGRRDLIAEYGIMNTRPKSCSIYPEVSDYLFTPIDMRVRSFRVDQRVVSDHLALFVEFEP